MSNSKHTDRCWTRYSGEYSNNSPLNNIPAPRAGITTFSVLMAASCIANRVQQHGLQIAVSILTYIISSSMSVFGVTVQRTNLEIMSLQTSNTPCRLRTYIECSAMPTPRQPMPSSRRAVLTKDSTCFDLIPVSWVTSQRLTYSLQCRSACLTTPRSGFFTLWRQRNGSTSTMQYGYPCLFTTSSHQKLSNMRKFHNGMGRKWRK